MGAGGAGQEYLKRRAETADLATESIQHTAAHSSASQRAALTTKNDIMNLKNANGKRLAKDVRLSPMKRTRFLTSRGVKEAGRDSLSGQKSFDTEIYDKDADDDDLDIVQ